MKSETEIKVDLMALNVSQAAARIGVSRPTMYELMNQSGFPVVRVGRRCLIPIRAFDNWLNEKAKEKPDTSVNVITEGHNE